MERATRIRTDGKFDHRKDIVKDVPAFYDCKKTRTLMLAGQDVQAFVGEIADLLKDEELSLAQRRELLDRFSDISLRFNFEFEADTGALLLQWR
ncbi:DUF7692 domain-containing protein [Halosimplex amylolyticum]|uniref:DUF7692 domain-containing protein n=1 Tax=Halosimplex amylolyticum TaxID=3396616 RepID=UPI003F5604EF